MRFAVIATEKSPTLLNHIVPAVKAKGHTLDVVSFGNVEVSDLLSSPVLQSLTHYDAVYYRTGLDIYGIELVGTYLDQHHIPCINFTQRIHPYILHKQYQITYAGAEGVRVPRTFMTNTPNHEYITSVLGVRYIAKAAESAQGRDVHAIKSPDELEELMPDWSTKRYLLQQYIPHTSDYRVHVIDGEVVTPYRRIPPKDDFRTNISRGGSMAPVEESEYERVASMAKHIATLFCTDVCAIDLIRNEQDGHMYFVEINLNPGWLGVRAEYGADPSGAVADLLAKRASSIAVRCLRK